MNGEPTTSTLDELERQLPATLQEDGRQPLARLSEKIGIAVSTINDRVKRLVRSATISGFDGAGCGGGRFDLLAFMLVSWSNPKVEAALLQRGGSWRKAEIRPNSHVSPVPRPHCGRALLLSRAMFSRPGRGSNSRRKAA